MLSMINEWIPLRKQQHSESPNNEPSTLHKDDPKVVMPLLPLPAAGSELHVCLCDFAAAYLVDLTECEAALSEVEFTPDITPHISVERLCSVTGSIEGRVIKLQQFCKEWYARFEIKWSQEATKHIRTE